MRRVIALVLVASIALAVAGSLLVQPQEQVAMGSCPTGEVRQSQQVISEQARAMSARDFASARQLATQAFRDNVSERQFAGIIASDYNFLLRDPRITFVSCEVFAPDFLLISARFNVEQEEHQLEYSMINEAGGWFVNSASNPKLRGLAV